MDKEVQVPILNNEYKVIVCFGNPERIKRVLKEWGHDLHTTAVDLDNGQRRGTTFNTNGCHPVIALPKRPKTPQEIGSLAHEAVHAIGYIFSMINQNMAEEVFAHSVGAIVRIVLKEKS